MVVLRKRKRRAVLRPTPTYLALSDIGQVAVPVEVVGEKGRVPNWVFYVGAAASVISLLVALGRKR